MKVFKTLLRAYEELKKVEKESLELKARRLIAQSLLELEVVGYTVEQEEQYEEFERRYREMLERSKDVQVEEEVVKSVVDKTEELRKKTEEFMDSLDEAFTDIMDFFDFLSISAFACEKYEEKVLKPALQEIRQIVNQDRKEDAQDA
ncbi:MAG: hypothetical protein ACK42C_00200 [Aquificaceae bacterium]